MKNILVICGPTASGKTSLALAIAKAVISSHHVNHVIPDLIRDPESRNTSLRVSYSNRGNLTSFHTINLLSVDSRQIYKGLDIVTGKDIPDNLPSSIKFFGLDLVNLDQAFNLSDYVQYAKKVIRESLDKNTPLIIVGGTGLYLKAITSNLLNVHVPPNKVLRQELEKLDLSPLQQRLRDLNPSKFASLNNSDVNNPRRLIRAIEISLSPVAISTNISSLREGTPTWQSPSTLSSSPTFHFIGLHQDKETQKQQIKNRVIARLESGAITEVESLVKKYPDKSLQIFSSLGVKQILSFLDRNVTREELIELWTASEVDYARRQMVWFRKQPDIIWYDNSKVDASLVDNLATIIKQNA